MPTLHWIGKEGDDLSRYDKWFCMIYSKRHSEV